jgi:uncharacterized protein
VGVVESLKWCIWIFEGFKKHNKNGVRKPMEKATKFGLGIRTETDEKASRFISGVYWQMMAGIMVTAFVAYVLNISGLIQTMAHYGGRGMFWGIFILQFGTVMAFQPMVQSANTKVLMSLFFFYAAVTGITVGFVSLVYSLTSILNVFVATSFAFGGLALFGHVTKRNLGVIGTFCLQALWICFGMSLIGAIGSYFPGFAAYFPAWNMTTGLLGTVVFSGLTAYESQIVRKMGYSLAERNADDVTVAVYTNAGALNMYLNFVNLFFSLLRLFGRRR